MKYYSDNGVDQSVELLLPDFGYAVDVGANNGNFNSNTLALEEKGWLVLCVEPNPLLAEEGRKTRRLWREVACGALDEDLRKFYAYGTHPFASGSALYPPKPGYVSAEDVEKPLNQHLVLVRTLNRLLEESGFPRVDFVTIDVEGYENEVLAGFDLSIWKPAVLCVESLNNDLETPNGYKLLERRMFDNVYVRDE